MHGWHLKVQTDDERQRVGNGQCYLSASEIFKACAGDRERNSTAKHIPAALEKHWSKRAVPARNATK